MFLLGVGLWCLLTLLTRMGRMLGFDLGKQPRAEVKGMWLTTPHIWMHRDQRWQPTILVSVLSPSTLIGTYERSMSCLLGTCTIIRVKPYLQTTNPKERSEGNRRQLTTAGTSRTVPTASYTSIRSTHWQPWVLPYAKYDVSLIFRTKWCFD